MIGNPVSGVPVVAEIRKVVLPGAIRVSTNGCPLNLGQSDFVSRWVIRMELSQEI